MSMRSKSDESGFIHSVKVPRIYKTASSIVKRVVENGESLKSLVYSTRHKNVKGVYALVVETIKHSQALNDLIEKSKLLEKETRLEPWLARVLITEMLFRKKDLKGPSKPVQTVLSYQKEFLRHFSIKRDFDSIKQVKKPRYVRVNTLRHTPDELIKMFRSQGWTFIQASSDYDSFLSTITQMAEDEFTKDFHVKELLVFPPTAKFYKNELYINGSIILQDKVTEVKQNEGRFIKRKVILCLRKIVVGEELKERVCEIMSKQMDILQPGSGFDLELSPRKDTQKIASCLPVCLLQPPANATVLDMCSAPGMKTSHLSAVMKNKGTIYAIEMNAARYGTLCDFVKRVGCTNIVPINADALKIGESQSCGASADTSWYKDVEYILLDPSCSGTGMVERRNIFKNEEKDDARIKKLCGFQYKLLLHALTSFPNVKRVVYCTCSVLPVENEKVVEDVLRKLSERKEVEKSGARFGFSYKLIEIMKDSWPRRGSGDFEVGRYCLCADPDKDRTNGFFIAVFERV